MILLSAIFAYLSLHWKINTNILNQKIPHMKLHLTWMTIYYRHTATDNIYQMIIGFIYIYIYIFFLTGFSGDSVVKKSACQCRRRRYDPWVRKITWRGKWQPIPVFLSQKSHGQRSLAGYSLWDCKELDISEQLSTHKDIHTHAHTYIYITHNTQFTILPF